MTRTLKLTDIDPGVQVELGREGAVNTFRMKPITIDVEEELMDVERELNRVREDENARPIDLMKAQVAQLDVILEPVPVPAGDGETSKPKTPSEALLPPYEQGKVTARQINHLVNSMMSAARPT
jgi:hypothetical protein